MTPWPAAPDIGPLRGWARRESMLPVVRVGDRHMVTGTGYLESQGDAPKGGGSARGEAFPGDSGQQEGSS